MERVTLLSPPPPPPPPSPASASSSHSESEAITFNIQAVKEVTVSGEELDTQIKLFSGSSADLIRHAFVTKMKLLREDVALSFTVVEDGGNETGLDG